MPPTPDVWVTSITILRPRRGRRRPANVTSMDMPRHWIVLQVLIVIFVLAGAVIAITKLA